MLILVIPTLISDDKNLCAIIEHTIVIITIATLGDMAPSETSPDNTFNIVSNMALIPTPHLATIMSSALIALYALPTNHPDVSNVGIPPGNIDGSIADIIATIIARTG